MPLPLDQQKQVQDMIDNHFDSNYRSGAPMIPPHTHNGVDNLQIDSFDLLNFPIPTGAVLPYGGSTAPIGWLLCDGAEISRQVYAALFRVIGVSFGIGDGSTTFELPNTHRRVLMGAGGVGTGTVGNLVGDTGGQENHILTIAEIPPHNHTIDVASFDTPGVTTVASTDDVTTATLVTGDTGGGAGHNTIQPSIIFNYIIKI